MASFEVTDATRYRWAQYGQQTYPFDQQLPMMLPASESEVCLYVGCAPYDLFRCTWDRHVVHFETPKEGASCMRQVRHARVDWALLRRDRAGRYDAHSIVERHDREMGELREAIARGAKRWFFVPVFMTLSDARWALQGPVVHCQVLPADDQHWHAAVLIIDAAHRRVHFAESQWSAGAAGTNPVVADVHEKMLAFSRGIGCAYVAHPLLDPGYEVCVESFPMGAALPKMCKLFAQAMALEFAQLQDDGNASDVSVEAFAARVFQRIDAYIKNYHTTPRAATQAKASKDLLAE